MRLSIITINFNNKIGLEKTINSVLNQSFQDFEYIIIDGGSNDGSLDIIEKYKNKINIVVSEQDTGVYNAMNKGIRLAQGEYLNFMNSGDVFFENNTLDKIKHSFCEKISLLYGNSLYRNADGSERNEIPPAKMTFLHFYRFGINHQATFIKRDLFEKYFYYNESYKICSDWEFFIYILFVGNESYKHLGEYICNYDFSGISAQPENFNLYNQEREETFKKYFSLFIDDYRIIDELSNKRVRNILYIKQFKPAWKLIKGFSNILLVFLPKRIS